MLGEIVVKHLAGVLPAAAISKLFAAVESHPIPLLSESDQSY
jgi:hypothetical protein